MNVKKILCLALALMMCCAMAVAEESDSDLQTQLDEANARIEELEAEVELYKPYYEAQIVAEYDGGIIFRDAALDEYSYYEDMFYSSYGINLEDYGLDTQYKQYALQSLVEEAVIMMNASELGLDQLDEETQADLQAQAEETQDSYISSVSSYFTSDDSTDEEVRESCIEYLDSIGYTLDYILESLTESYIYEQVYNYITADVEVTEEDIQTTYDELVESQQESFESDSTYNSTRNDGDLIVWNPEGYRAVKQVLIMFDDDQSTTYDDLTSTLSDLEDELATIQAAAEEETAEDTEEETTEDTEETEEEEVELRTEEEVQADIDAIQEELDALYDELMPTAQEVIDKFNEGTSFSVLIDV